MRINVISLGCPKNLVDTENMIGILGSMGHSLAERASDADVILINTCGFIEPAKKEALDEIVRAIRRKQKRDSLRIVAAGCFVQRYSALLRDEFPEIDGFLGVNNLQDVGVLIDEIYAGRRPVMVDNEKKVHVPGLRLVTTGPVAYLKISEGCDNRCSYCAIPIIRGAMASRPKHEVLDEARALGGLGVREAVIVAQDPTRYGLDTVGTHLLPELCADLASVEGVELIRLMYAHPARLDVLREALVSSRKVCRYADIPVQHVSEQVLRRMGRKGSREEYLDGLQRLRESLPGISLRSTFMVGFPGETETDFQELLRFIQEARFEHAGVFKYSPEEGTVAFAYADSVPADIAAGRYHDALRLQQQVSLEEHSRRIGQTTRFLVERYSNNGFTGRTEFQAPEIDGVTRLSSDQTCGIGQVVTCTITGVIGQDFEANENNGNRAR